MNLGPIPAARQRRRPFSVVRSALATSRGLSKSSWAESAACESAEGSRSVSITPVMSTSATRAVDHRVSEPKVAHSDASERDTEYRFVGFMSPDRIRQRDAYTSGKARLESAGGWL